MVGPVYGWSSVWLVQCVVGPVCGWSSVWLVQCMVGPVCGWSSVWLVQCVVGPVYGWSNTWLMQHVVGPGCAPTVPEPKGPHGTRAIGLCTDLFLVPLFPGQGRHTAFRVDND